uniref:5-formyltetrahydrofolate cyclo-ligase n=1 Tax=Caenorhabditis japonica TaxID=281687 RepID=A0A8R1DTP6_CAEJA
MLEKSELRKLMKTCLSKLSFEETQRQSEAVCRKIQDSKCFENSQRISIYVSTHGEIGTDSIIRKALELGKDVFIPQFTKGSTAMEMVRVPNQHAFDTLPTTLWGIRQPDPQWNWEPYQNSGPLDVVLTPGVAFTASGLRCGHGKGYYDRFFATHSTIFGREPLRIGLALREQIVENLPVSGTDVRLDQVIFDGEEN